MSDFTVQSATDLTWYLNWMLVGLPGSGKTALASTLQNHPDTTGVLILPVEGGMLTLKNMNWDEFGPPSVLDMPDMKTLEEIYWALVRQSEEFAHIKTVVIDSLTELSAMDLETTTRRNMGKTTRSGKRRENVDDAWLEDRGEVSGRQARIVRGFRDMPRNFVATARPRLTYTKDGEGMPQMHLPPVRCEPGFGDRLRQHLCGYMDYVWYLKEGEGNYHDVLTRSKGPYYAKSRAEGFKRFGGIVRWPAGTPLLADVWDCEINGKPFPTNKYSISSGEEPNK
jgi:hypothetical protein